MDMMRGALSMSYSPVDIGLLSPSAGIFAVSPDGRLRFHATLALSDVPAPTVDVTVSTTVLWLELLRCFDSSGGLTRGRTSRWIPAPTGPPTPAGSRGCSTSSCGILCSNL